MDKSLKETRRTTNWVDRELPLKEFKQALNLPEKERVVSVHVDYRSVTITCMEEMND